MKTSVDARGLAEALLDREVFEHSVRILQFIDLQEVVDRTGFDADEIVSAAILHDVVEDTDLTVEDILAGFGPVVASAVDAVTRRVGRETYAEFIRRAASHPLGRVVKLADVFDHLAQSETLKPSLLPRYRRAASVLMGALDG